MRISVTGAAGMVGTQIAAEAAARHHDVTTYTRSGNLTGSQALDFSDTSAVHAIVNTSDVTIISVASRDDYQAAIDAHKRLIESQPSGRMIVIGGAGALSIGDDRLLLDSPDFPDEYRPEAQAFAAVYQEYLASNNLNWTMVAPSPIIAPGVRTGTYTTALNTPAGNFVSTQDFAVAVIDEAESPQHEKQRFTVASSDEHAAQG